MPWPKVQTKQPRGTFRVGDVHPDRNDRVFSHYRKDDSEVWMSPECYDRKKKAQNAHKKTRREKDNELARVRYAKDPSKKAASHKKWCVKNKEYLVKYREENKALFASHASKRRAKIKGNIKLHRDAQDALQGVFKLRETLTLCARAAGSSEAFHVDHIWPLKPKKVKFRGKRIRPYVGLHAPWNLQILEASENISKNNKTPTL